MENKKKIPAIVATTIILLSFLMVAFEVQTTLADSITGDYAFVNGVLASDKYSLYPFAKKSLTIGFSKYGELVDDRNNIGLEYGAVDPFAAPAGSAVGSIPKVLWIQGWLLNISYYNIPQGKNRNVWAYAAFSDANTYGGSWIRVDFANDWSATYGWEDPRDPGYIIGNYEAGGLNFGGRKTNGTAVTQPITVLYNGPRLFVALLNTTIYDHPVFLSDSTANDIPLARVLITIIFNKVKKEVVLLKDVKSLLTEKTGVSMNIQFSNRGEVDLGTEATGYHSNFHFFTQGTHSTYDTLTEGQSTVYNRDWTICPTVDLGADTVFGGMPQTGAATYDVAQAINTAAGYVWWAAFWPSLSDWTIDGWGIHWKSMTEADPHWVDGNPDSGGEPRIPFYIGEWDFRLYAKEYALTNPIEFRGVTVYGITDLNDGSDDLRRIDTEVKYQLNEVFNPWDLAQAVHKDNARDVKFVSGPLSSGVVIQLGEPLVAAKWGTYCNFTERVLLLPDGTLWKRGTQYDLNDMDDDGAYDSIKLKTSVASGKTLKILYSTETYWESADPVEFTFFAENNNTLSDDNSTSWTDPLGITHTADINNIRITAETDATEDFEETLNFTVYGWETDFKVFKGSTYACSWDYYEPTIEEGDYATVTLEFLDIHWLITAPEYKDVHVWELGFEATVEVTVSYNATEDVMNITAVVTLAPPEDYANIDVLYAESIPGRYEWGIVGRDADSVDSAGLSMVSAALKNKQVEYGLAGADMYASEPYNQMPYVMHKFGTGNTKADYYYSGTDYRTALRDDWCYAGTVVGDEVPVASSNMIGVGGPLANLLAYYGNDFAQAIYGLNQFTDYTAWEEAIIPLTCWSTTKTQTYRSTNTTGYAVISTYKDINGTVLFLVWGHWGRDTYYASKWFHEEGIYQLQQAPRGLTAIILKITFESTTEGYKPTGYSIVECLGTISETKWTHGSEIKGGIHDP